MKSSKEYLEDPRNFHLDSHSREVMPLWKVKKLLKLQEEEIFKEFRNGFNYLDVAKKEVIKFRDIIERVEEKVQKR